MPLTPAELSLNGRAASNESWARTVDREARTRKAREAILEKFEQQADPDNKLTPAERRRRAISLRTAHMQRLAIKSVRARRARKEAHAEDRIVAHLTDADSN
jgi:hypothetical protein